MMYSGYPKATRLQIRGSLAAAWAFTALSGIAGIFLTPASLTEELGPTLPTITGFIVLVSSLGAIYGVVRDHYAAELVSAWFAAAGTFVYVLVVWYLAIVASPTRVQQAAALTSLLFFYIFRMAICSAHAKKQRQIHALVASGKWRVSDA